MIRYLIPRKCGIDGPKSENGRGRHRFPVNEKRNQIACKDCTNTRPSSKPGHLFDRVVVVPGEHDAEDGGYMKNISKDRAGAVDRPVRFREQ